MKIKPKTFGLSLALALILAAVFTLLFLYPDTAGVAIGILLLIVVCYNIIDVFLENPERKK